MRRLDAARRRRLAGHPDGEARCVPDRPRGRRPGLRGVVVDRQGAARRYESFVDARNGRILARQNLVHNAASGAASSALSTVTPFSGTLPPRTRAAVPHHGRSRSAPASARSTASSAATIPTNDLVLELFRVGTPDVLLSRPTRGFQPERFHYEPAGGVPPGDYYVKVCDFAGGGGPGRAADVHRHDHVRRHARPARRIWAVEGVPGHAAPARTRCRRIRGTCRARTSARRGAGVDGAPAATGSSAEPRLAGLRGITTSKPNVPTFTTIGQQRETATNSWPHQTAPEPAAVLADEPDPGLHVSRGRTSWNQTDCASAPARSRASPSTSRRRSRTCSSPTTGCTTGRTTSGSPRELERTGATTSASPSAGSENDPVTGEPRPEPIPTPRASSRATTRTWSRCPTAVARLRTCTSGSRRRASFYAPCADGDYDMPSSATSTAT